MNAGEITLRDYLAAKAFQALISNGRVPLDKLQVAAVAYEYADAMLLRRASIPLPCDSQPK